MKLMLKCVYCDRESGYILERDLITTGLLKQGAINCATMVCHYCHKSQEVAIEVKTRKGLFNEILEESQARNEAEFNNAVADFFAALLPKEQR